MQDFRNIKVWSESHQLALKIHEITTEFPKSETLNRTSKLRRASVSIPNNIAEGCEINSDKNFFRFLHISLESTNKVLYFNYLIKRFKIN